MNSQIHPHGDFESNIAVRIARGRSALSTFSRWFVAACAVSKSAKNSEEVQCAIRASRQMSPSLAQELSVIAGRG